MAVGAEAIKALCDSWLEAAHGADGAMHLGPPTDPYRLLANDVVFHELDHDAMREACLGLSRVLLLPGLSAVISSDHLWFWAWCGEVLCTPHWEHPSDGPLPYFSEAEMELLKLLGLCIRAALSTLPAWAYEAQSPWDLDANGRQWLRGGRSTLAYLAFPLLEAVVKKHLREYVDMHGRVLQDFTVPRDAGAEPKPYSADGRNKTCSSLRDLLYLLFERVASNELRRDLGEQRAHLAAFADKVPDGFDVIYRWRNGSLHGAVSLPTVGGIVLNTALLIALSDLRDGYERAREEVLQRVQMHMSRCAAIGPQYRSDLSYYPPYL